MFRIEALLAARLFLAPQLVGNQLYFVSNLSGRLSLYQMDFGGSVPQPLLPPHIALQNPDFVNRLYYVFPGLDKIIVMLDQDGDERYQPMFVPLAGGFPEPVFPDLPEGYRFQLGPCDRERNIVYLFAEAIDARRVRTYQADLTRRELRLLGESVWGMWAQDHDRTHEQVLLSEGYTVGDNVILLWRSEQEGVQVIHGVPMQERSPDYVPPLSAIHATHFADAGGGLLFISAIFDDAYGLAYSALEPGAEIVPVRIEGVVHTGTGELENLERLVDERYVVSFNIDGVTWLYEGRFVPAERKMVLEHVLVGRGDLENGVLESHAYDEVGDRHVLSFSKATSPTQLYTIGGPRRDEIVCHTDERVLGIPEHYLSAGEDASYISHDETRISARLYLPAAELPFEAPFPLIYYIHGGPQSQERPNFAWFSMPLIQFLTLNGFAVFVPNVRGSSGYGLGYMKQVDRDWGGADRLDHVHAVEEVLPADPRIDVTRAGVVGRSYGGYMTLTLASRHPQLWSAAVDMFGPYNLLTFMDRLPETWKPYFYMALGHPERDRVFLLERSPATYMQQIDMPLLVIQGANDPRVIARESQDVVEGLNAAGKTAKLLLFPDEGHDILKYENKVRCYNEITDFFRRHLAP